MLANPTNPYCLQMFWEESLDVAAPTFRCFSGKNFMALCRSDWEHIYQILDLDPFQHYIILIRVAELLKQRIKIRSDLYIVNNCKVAEPVSGFRDS